MARRRRPKSGCDTAGQRHLPQRVTAALYVETRGQRIRESGDTGDTRPRPVCPRSFATFPQIGRGSGTPGTEGTLSRHRPPRPWHSSTARRSRLHCVPVARRRRAHRTAPHVYPPNGNIYGMENKGSEPARLHTEIQALNVKLMGSYQTFTHGWQFKWGPFYFSKHVNSTHITQVYIVFNSICFIAGIVLALLGGNISVVGISLIVGSVFSFGTFVSQFWTVVTQNELDSDRQIDPSGYFAATEDMRQKRDALLRRSWDLEERKKDSQKGKSNLRVIYREPSVRHRARPRPTTFRRAPKHQ
jgi:hypothetical protein